MTQRLRLKPSAVVRFKSGAAKPAASPLEMAKRFRAQIDGGESETGLQLAQAQGLSPSTVSRLLAVLKMSAALQQLVDAGMRLQTAARIHALGPSESARIVRGLNAGQTLRSLLGEAKPRAPRTPRRGTRKLREGFAARLVEARLSRRLTQEHFGAAVGVGQSTVGSWETAKALPEVETLIRLADHLNVSIDWLLGRRS